MTPKPELVGPHSKAWKFDLDAMAIKYKRPHHASLVSWFVYAPWANCSWHSYGVYLIHLRPVPGDPPPIMNLPGATHEVIVVAIHPDWQLDLSEHAPFLQPVNFVGQFIATDDEALARVQKAVTDICDGTLSPDTDYTQHWIHRFGASNIKGDPKTAGQTILMLGSRQVVFDPAPLSRRPIDKVCKRCRHPLTHANLELVGLPNPAPDGVCIRCFRGERQ